MRMITLLFPNYVSITNPPLSGVVWQGYKVRPSLVDPVAAFYGPIPISLFLPYFDSRLFPFCNFLREFSGFNGPRSRSSLLCLALQLLQQSFLAMETRQGRGVCFCFSFSSTNRLASQVRLLLGVLSEKLEKAKGLGGSGELHPSMLGSYMT